MARSMADRAHAAVELAAGRPDTAAQHALASVAAADEVGMPVDAALSRTLAGRALAQAGQHERAVTELRRAAEDLHACGALRYRAAAESELRKLGQHISRRTRPGNRHGSGIESLTSRERQIAQLVVDRKTNREIAETLFLSPKTVETHMRTLFHKLECLLPRRGRARSRAIRYVTGVLIPLFQLTAGQEYPELDPGRRADVEVTAPSTTDLDRSVPTRRNPRPPAPRVN